MSIEIKNYEDLDTLMKETDDYLTYIDSDNHFFFDLEKKDQSTIRHMIKSSKLIDTMKILTNEDITPEFDYSEFSEFQDRVFNFSENLKNMKEKIDLDKFVASGQFCNFKTLKKLFKDLNLKDRFPNFNFKVYQEWLTNPPLAINNSKGETIEYDSYVVIKLLNLLHHMIFDEDDILLVFCGKEGSAKSTLASQIMLYMYTFITSVGLNNYEFKPELMFYVDLQKMQDFESELEYADYFRIIHFDEGDQLSRINFRDKSVIKYKSDLRRSRKKQRIRSIATPQIGELSQEIITTRTHFIFNTIMTTDNETKLLKKGICNLYIIPKGDFIYSDLNKREITRSEILTTLHEQLKNKENYYRPLPTDICVRQFKFGRHFGFDKKEYDEYIDKENKLVDEDDGFKLTSHQIYVMLKEMPDFGEWGFDTKDVISNRNYTLMRQLKTKFKKYFIKYPKVYHELKMKEEMLREFGK